MNDMVDMSRFVEAKSDQLNADDLIGAPRTITVTRVTGNDGDQPVSIFFQGDNGKPFKPCKTVRRVLMAVWGRYANDYVGKSMTLYRDDSVTFGGLATGGIRVSHMSGIEKDTVVVVMKTKGKKAGLKIQPLRIDQQRQHQPDDDGRSIAEKKVEQYVGNVARAPSAEKLVEYQGNKAAWIASLREAFPDLHQRCVDAGTKRAAELAPHQPEGRDDRDMGEGFTDEGDPFASDIQGDD